MYRGSTVFAALFLLSTMAPTCGEITRGDCLDLAWCRIIEDANGDGDIADDLRIARNDLIYVQGYGPGHAIMFFPPDPGTYQWNGTVHFCGDDTNPPTGDAEPDCDGVSGLPKIIFNGRWDLVQLDADCAEGDTTIGTITACLHVGDRMWGDGGATEPRAKVDTGGRVMRFHHAQTPSTVDQLQHMVPAVWLDGVVDSDFKVEVVSDVPPSPDVTQSGTGMYASAESSLIRFESQTGANVLMNGLILDGVMTGSNVEVDIDISGSPIGAGGYVLVGSIGYFLNQVFGAGGPPDSCEYGPDLRGAADLCKDFTLDMSLVTPGGDVGYNGLDIYEAANLLVHTDFDYRTIDHLPVRLNPGCVWLFGNSTPCPGDVTNITIDGSIVYEAPTGAIVAHFDSDALVDAVIQNNGNATACLQSNTGGVLTTGPNYQCILANP